MLNLLSFAIRVVVTLTFYSKKTFEMLLRVPIFFTFTPLNELLITTQNLYHGSKEVTESRS